MILPLATAIDTLVKLPPVGALSLLDTNLATQFAAVSCASTTKSTSTTMSTPASSTPPPTPQAQPRSISTFTPKMSQLLGLNSVGNSATISYFGPMNFLDDQVSFTSVFGQKLQFLDLIHLV